MFGVVTLDQVIRWSEQQEGRENLMGKQQKPTAKRQRQGQAQGHKSPAGQTHGTAASLRAINTRIENLTATVTDVLDRVEALEGRVPTAPAVPPKPDGPK